VLSTCGRRCVNRTSKMSIPFAAAYQFHVGITLRVQQRVYSTKDRDLVRITIVPLVHRQLSLSHTGNDLGTLDAMDLLFTDSAASRRCWVDVPEYARIPHLQDWQSNTAESRLGRNVKTPGLYMLATEKWR
jgi:hypothetical protein